MSGVSKYDIVIHCKSKNKQDEVLKILQNAKRKIYQNEHHSFGGWIPDKDGGYNCKDCGTWSTRASKYCPDCGRRMEVEDNE